MRIDNKKKVRPIIEAISIGIKFASIGIQLAFSVIAGGFIGLLIGHIINQLFGIRLFVLFLIFGLLLGFISGIYYIYKIALTI